MIPHLVLSHTIRRAVVLPLLGTLALPLLTSAATGDSLSSASSSVPSVSSVSSASSASSIAPELLVDYGKGTLYVEQVSPITTLGTWTLLKPNNEKFVGALQNHTLVDLQAPGNYTILVEPPTGASASIRLYNGQDEITSVDRSQLTFQLFKDNNLRAIITYSFSRVGTVSVQSDPQKVPFTLTGPNNTKIESQTPGTFPNMPEGQYKVQYGQLEGCVMPPPKSLLLQKNSRVSFDVKFSCPTADKMRAEQENKNTDGGHISVSVGGESIQFRDVAQDAWYAEAVFSMAKIGVLSGYKDERGELTGEFGPDKNVTIAELAKIAHRIVGLDEAANSLPSNNPFAQEGWYSTFFASAEQHGWTIYADATIDPNRTATRGEVLVTLLQVFDVPLSWQKGGVFADVVPRTAYAAAIETAANDGVVEGRKDGSGASTGQFGPADPVNRAEMAKILQTALKTYKLADNSAK